MERMVDRTLVISAAERERLSDLEAKGVMTVQPVALPVGSHLKGSNHHLGWPVGIKVGETLLCAYHQTLRHHGEGPRQDASSSHAVIVRSTDGGRTWSDPVDLRTFGVTQDPMSVREMNSFAVLDNKVFLATTYGLYVSDNEGRSWELIPGALTRKQTGNPYDGAGGAGPRMMVHPQKGLVVVNGVARQPFMDLYHSTDEGRTWNHERVQVSNTIHPLEPTFLYHDGHLIFLTRNHTLPFRWHHQVRETQRPAMMVSDTGWFPMTHQAVTNISAYRWPDTTDVDFNPVSHRFEAVVTNRSGGAETDEKNEQHEQTVNLWSISKEDMYAGRADQWRLEGTLLRFESGMLDITPDDIDAAHPGGAVIDEAEGVQHIFIYCGRYATPTGIYRISRTLDTHKLREAMRPHEAEGAAATHAP